MANDDQWESTAEKIRWALADPGADPRGRKGMVDAVRQGDLKFIAQFKNGFNIVLKNSATDRANFDACAKENEKRLYNLARVALKLPPLR